MTNLRTLQKADNQALIPSEETLALSVIRRVQMDGGLEKETSFCTSPIFDSPVWLLGGCTSANVVIVRQWCLWPKKGSVTENCFSLGWHLLLFVHKMSVPLSQRGENYLLKASSNFSQSENGPFSSELKGMSPVKFVIVFSFLFAGCEFVIKMLPWPSPSLSITHWHISPKFASCITSGNSWLITLFGREKCKWSQTAGAFLAAQSDGGARAHLIRGPHTLLPRQAPAGGQQRGCQSSRNRWPGGEQGGEAQCAGDTRKRWCVSRPSTQMQHSGQSLRTATYLRAKRAQDAG